MFYCEQHLPSFLIKAKKAGLLKTTESLAKAMAEGLETLTKKSNDVKEQTVAEPVVEEPVVEKPKKKAAKKKAE